MEDSAIMPRNVIQRRVPQYAFKRAIPTEGDLGLVLVYRFHCLSILRRLDDVD